MDELGSQVDFKIFPVNEKNDSIVEHNINEIKPKIDDLIEQNVEFKNSITDIKEFNKSLSKKIDMLFPSNFLNKDLTFYLDDRYDIIYPVFPVVTSVENFPILNQGTSNKVHPENLSGKTLEPKNSAANFKIILFIGGFTFLLVIGTIIGVIVGVLGILFLELFKKNLLRIYIF